LRRSFFEQDLRGLEILWEHAILWHLLAGLEPFLKILVLGLAGFELGFYEEVEVLEF